MYELVHAGIEALTFGTPVHSLLLFLPVIRSGAHTVVLHHQALNLRVILKRKNEKSKLKSNL